MRGEKLKDELTEQFWVEQWLAAKPEDPGVWCPCSPTCDTTKKAFAHLEANEKDDPSAKYRVVMRLIREVDSVLYQQGEEEVCQN